MRWWTSQIIVVLLIAGIAAPGVVAQSTHDSTPLLTWGNMSGRNGVIQLVKDSNEKVWPALRKKKLRQSKKHKRIAPMPTWCSRCCPTGQEMCCLFCDE